MILTEEGCSREALGRQRQAYLRPARSTEQDPRQLRLQIILSQKAKRTLIQLLKKQSVA